MFYSEELEEEWDKSKVLRRNASFFFKQDHGYVVMNESKDKKIGLAT